MLVLSGCAAIQSQGAADSENSSPRAAPRRPSSSRRPDNIQPRQLTKHGRSHDFADPRFCKCRYTGGDKELTVLNDLRARACARTRLGARHRLTSAGADEKLGAWKPEGLDVR